MSIKLGQAPLVSGAQPLLQYDPLQHASMLADPQIDPALAQEIQDPLLPPMSAGAVE